MKNILLCIGLFLGTLVAFAAPFFFGLNATVAAGSTPVHTVSNGGTTTGFSSSTITFSITPTGFNRIMIVDTCLYGGGATITGVTFNSVALTPVPGIAGNFIDGSGKHASFSLIAPAATTANVVVTFSSAPDSSSATASCFSGVNQATPFGTIASALSGGATTTLTPASTTSDLVVIASAYYNSPGSDGVGQTLARASELGSANLATRISYKAGAASTTSMSVTATADCWAWAVALKP